MSEPASPSPNTQIRADHGLRPVDVPHAERLEGGPAARTCRRPARRRPAGPGWPPRWPPAAALSSAQRRLATGTTTTPSSSAHDDVAGRHDPRPSTTGTLTDPALAFTVPWHETCCDPHGEAHLAQLGGMSRTPASMTRARTPGHQRRRQQVAEHPVCEGEVVVTTSTSPARHTSTAAWIIRLSPGWHDTVTAEPASRAPAGWAGGAGRRAARWLRARWRCRARRGRRRRPGRPGRRCAPPAGGPVTAPPPPRRPGTAGRSLPCRPVGPGPGRTRGALAW